MDLSGGGNIQSWQGKYVIRTDETDEDHRVEVSALVSYLQDAAAHHARELDVSVDDLRNHGRAWVLARLQLEVSNYPRWGDEVTVRTWPAGVGRLFALRDYQVIDSDGVELAAARSAWFMINIESRRPARLPEEFSRIVGRVADDTVPRIAFDWAELDLARAEHADVAQIQVRHSDTDFNGHVNHVRYLEWMLAESRNSARDRLEIRGFHVEFRAEALPGDALTCQSVQDATGSDGAVLNHVLVRESDNRPITLGQSRWVVNNRTV